MNAETKSESRRNAERKLLERLVDIYEHESAFGFLTWLTEMSQLYRDAKKLLRGQR
jgi:hypothetical protein